MTWRHRIAIATSLLLLVLAIGAGPVSHKAPTKVVIPGAKAPTRVIIPGATMEAMLGDPRIETVARAICLARGIDPDTEGLPYPPGPIWEYFVPEASLFLAQYDAARGSK